MTGNSGSSSNAAERDLQTALKRVTAEHLQQQNVNKAMSNRIMRLEKEATDERRRRIELEAKLSTLGGLRSGKADSSVQRSLEEV
jgi:predicted RNase H-like nuclease (RuvC/YqgF family)